MLAWLDFDSAAMKRANELLQQFRDARTLDHLRLSGIRDDFANHFFPATSTIMPHARYLILVPRAFLRLETEIRKKGYSLQQATRRLDEIEAEQAADLISEVSNKVKKKDPERKDLEGSGIIGWEKIRETNGAEFVTQTPSINYWASIRRLKIRLPKGSRPTYIRDLIGRSKLKSNHAGVPEDEALGLDSVIWNKDALDLARDVDRGCLELNAKQAGFIQKQYVTLDRLMSRLLVNDSAQFATKDALNEISYVWDYPTLPESDLNIIECARKLSALIQGANLVYGAMVINEYGLEKHPDFNEWLPTFEEWFDLSESDLGAKAARKLEWASVNTICLERSLDLHFLKEIQSNLRTAKSSDEFLKLCTSVIERREKTIKPVNFRLGRTKGGNAADKKKYKERVLRQPIRLTQAPDFRWGMASEFMWNINTGLGKWG